MDVDLDALKITRFIDALPVLDNPSVAAEDSCPICLVTFTSLLANSDLVTKLEGCGHVFCKKDLVEWISNQHGNCPTCRHTFLEIRPRSESDDESSDGGEYIPPNEDEEEDEDTFLDGFSEPDVDITEFDMDEMELDLDDVWEDSTETDIDADTEMDENGDWGLTDGESESMSDGGTSGEGDVSELLAVSVHVADDLSSDEVQEETK